jgi:hypothetical protein
MAPGRALNSCTSAAARLGRAGPWVPVLVCRCACAHLRVCVCACTRTRAALRSDSDAKSMRRPSRDSDRVRVRARARACACVSHNADRCVRLCQTADRVRVLARVRASNDPRLAQPRACVSACARSCGLRARRARACACARHGACGIKVGRPSPPPPTTGHPGGNSGNLKPGPKTADSEYSRLPRRHSGLWEH